jgi:hypothetical protein
MIVELFDRPTMAAMEWALERLCERWPCGGKHNVRKRVAQRIIRCTRTGNTSLDALLFTALRIGRCLGSKFLTNRSSSRNSVSRVPKRF